MNNLKHEHWEPDENVCYGKILNIMNNVKNSTLWATWSKYFVKIYNDNKLYNI